MSKTKLIQARLSKGFSQEELADLIVCHSLIIAAEKADAQT